MQLIVVWLRQSERCNLTSQIWMTEARSEWFWLLFFPFGSGKGNSFMAHWKEFLNMKLTWSCSFIQLNRGSMEAQRRTENDDKSCTLFVVFTRINCVLITFFAKNDENFVFGRFQRASNPFHHNGNRSFIIFEPLNACAEVNYSRWNDFADFN